jgi:hypothetical protein
MINSLEAKVKSGNLGALMQFDLQGTDYRTQRGSAGSYRLLNIQQLSLCTARCLQHPAPPRWVLYSLAKLHRYQLGVWAEGLPLRVLGAWTTVAERDDSILLRVCGNARQVANIFRSGNALMAEIFTTSLTIRWMQKFRLRWKS